MVFLSVIGPTTYKLLASLIAPEKPGDKDYKELVKVVKEHHNPTPSEIVRIYKFHTRTRQPSETTTQFVAELRALAQYCNFGASLTDLLRDRIVCGINDDQVQRRLLSEKALTFEKALELAVSLETARKFVSELQETAMPQAYIELQITHATIAGEEGTNRTNADSSKLSVSVVVKLATSKEFAEPPQNQARPPQRNLETTSLSPSGNSLGKKRRLLNSFKTILVRTIMLYN